MDKYDVAVEYLMGCNGNFDREVREAWGHPQSHRAGCLFQMVRKEYEHGIGCLTMVKNGMFKASTEELTLAIRADERIPEALLDIRKEHLPLFVEWQREIDQKLQRV